MKGLHKSVRLSFMTVGHTKFSPDWCFGLLKQRMRHTKIDCLADIADVITKSAKVNEAQLVGSQSGEVIVKSYEWTGFLAPKFKRIKNITKQHHFEYTNDQGSITFREFSDSTNTDIKLLKDGASFSRSDFPELILPRGLSLEREYYLYDKIAEYCSEETRDQVCPKPQFPWPSGSSRASSPARSTGSDELETTPQKRQRTCGECREMGHNKRTCNARGQ